MKRSLLLFCMLSFFLANAQIKRFSFKAAANYPSIPTVRTSNEVTALPMSAGYISSVTTATIKESYESKVGFDLGGTIDYSVTPRFFISTGLNLSYLRFKKSVMIDDLTGSEIQQMRGSVSLSPNAGAPFGGIFGTDADGNVIIREGMPTEPLSLNPSQDNGNTTTLYMQVPVLMGTTFFHDKLILRAGASLSCLVSATQYSDKYSFTHGTVESYKEKSRDGYSLFLVSGTITTTYMVTRAIGIDLSANKFFTPIYDQPGQSGDKAKYTTFTLGVNYSINR